MMAWMKGEVTSFWTVQPREVWTTLEADGVIHVREDRIPAGGVHPQYRWLSDQLTRRLPGWEGRLSWWMYARRPDLRAIRHLRSGDQVLIEVAAPALRVVSFPCWAWHDVFCATHLARSRDEALAWYRRVRSAVSARPAELMFDDYPKVLREELERSWERLFDPELPACSWQRRRSSTSREAVVDELRVDWIRSVRHFRGVERRRAGL
ncbi:MAG: DUF3841 domain-containing protein [Phycisphaerales bacterium]|nr:DUF3841 domain-containing protein [Phycisphaerales bacterium]